jgi:16S rRNA (uracil1498-N3)-methyltransferase
MGERFYVNRALAPGPVELTGDEAHHLATVCRLRSGDLVCLFNGDGKEYPARIEESGRRSVTLEVLEARGPEREVGWPLEVACAVPKGDREQFLVEKLVELGATRFVPLRTTHSVVVPRESRLRRYVIEASKQCGRNVLMDVTPAVTWSDYCRLTDLPPVKLIAHPGAQPPGDVQPGRRGVVLAVGPEAGFTEDEVELARGAGWRVVGLGPRILRVETAALVLASRFNGS